jgi:hypothetical protein
MSSLTNKDYEIYNLNHTSEYAGPLINGKINDYFNDILTKPEIKPISMITKSEKNWGKFYRDYLEPNLLFFVLLIGVCIFLVIRYYTMDMDPGKERFNKLDDFIDEDEYDEDENDEDEDMDLNNPHSYIKNHKKKIKKKYKTRIKKYKDELSNEKQKILDLIDELSSINYEDEKRYNKLNQDYQNQLLLFEQQRKLENVEQMRQLEELRRLGQIVKAKNNDGFSNQFVKFNTNSNTNANTNANTKTNGTKLSGFIENDRPSKNPLDYTIKNVDTDTDADDDSNYFKVNKSNNYNQDNYIDGLYIDTPYN